MRCAGLVARRGRGENYIQGCGGKPEGKRPLAILWCNEEYDIKMDLKELSWEAMEWIDLSQDMDKWWTVLKTAINRRVP